MGAKLRETSFIRRFEKFVWISVVYDIIPWCRHYICMCFAALKTEFVFFCVLIKLLLFLLRGSWMIQVLNHLHFNRHIYWSFYSQLLVISTSLSTADVSHIVHSGPYNEPLIDTTTTTTPQPPPHPYVFSYTAGRYRGHVDRAHSEVSDGSGTVRGAFSYIDPRQQIRSVEYVADKDGFHPVLSHPNAEPEQSEAVKLATLRHLKLFNQIAEANANVSKNFLFC